MSPVKRICVFEHSVMTNAQPFREARDLAFCLKVPLDSLLVWASSEGSGETARMRRLAWTFAARIGYKYQIRLTRSKCFEIKIFEYLLETMCVFYFSKLALVCRMNSQEHGIHFIPLQKWNEYTARYTAELICRYRSRFFFQVKNLVVF